ncbi:HEAT repeat-containing protein 4-like isoform X1 [Bolinopsis microptera]|uniref:HEAT repeat-containing protein 4-like isoform X1 n=1 Tax=Bolinopsis microptera TaxID=2820187 RepID=UPI003078D678
MITSDVLNIGLNFSRDVVSESAPSALRFEQIRARDIYSAPKTLLSSKKSVVNKGIQGRHNAIGDPIPHLPCALTVPAENVDLRRTKAYPVKPYLKKVVQEEESIAAQTSVAASTTQWDEYVLNKLSFDTADIIVNRHSHGLQRERLQQKVLSDAKDEVDSIIFQETQFMEVEPILVERKHGIEADSSKVSLSSFVLSESDKETVVTKTKEEKPSVMEEEHYPAYLDSGKPLQRNYMEKFMTKAQRKREHQPADDRYISSNYNRHKILNDIEPFTEDILQGKLSIHHPGNRSKIIFDTQTQYKRDLIPLYPQQPTTWGPPKQLHKRLNVPIKGARPWKNYPHLIITTYQCQVLNDMTSESDERTTPGLSDNLLDSDELTHDLLLGALSTWRTTWYLDNKWRDSSLENLIVDMKDISEHVRITAAIACGAALGFRSDWDLDEEPELKSDVEDGDDVPISGYRTYSPSIAASSTERSTGHVVVDNLQKLLFDKSDRVQCSSAVTLLAIGASNERAKQVLLRALHRVNSMVADTWAAVQCLAMENVTERIVVDKLITMTQSLDTLIRVTATKLLVRLSHHSDVILFMVADELNNRLWINRYMACKVIQKIHTPLNKDILHKLLTLMWSDYSENIKSVAGETIGVKGYGHVLHDELCCRLRKGNEAERVDALNRVVHLRMMTGRMKSVFLKCFTDDHVSVRHNAAKGAGELQFSDEDVIEGLLTLISEDHSHKVKAAAIEALADIGVVNDKIISQLVWSAQYQQEGLVRSAACLVLAILKVDREDVVNVLRDRLTADADNSVKKASTQALQMLGLKPEKDASLILAIKEAVKKLGSKEAILSSIINSDSQSNNDCYSCENAELGLKSRGSKVSVTRGNTRGEVRSRESLPKREKTSDSLKFEWPDPMKVITRDKEIKMKKDKIQAILKEHDKKEPTAKFLWRKAPVQSPLSTNTAKA